MPVCTVDEVVEHAVGIRRGANGVVGQKEFAQLTVVIRFAGVDPRLFQAWRLWDGVRVEDRFRHLTVPRPEAVTDDLVRIRLAHERRTVARWRGPARKARHGEVEAAPEEMHRADLPVERASGGGEHPFDVDQDPPHPARVFGIVRPVNRVFVKADWRGDLDRYRPDLHRQLHLVERANDVPVEIGDAARRERDRPSDAIRHADRQQVIDEVEFHRERPASLRQRACREAARGDVQRDAPRMVQRRCVRERDLADNLRPHVQRRVRFPPGVVRQCRPGLLGHSAMIRCENARHVRASRRGQQRQARVPA